MGLRAVAVLVALIALSVWLTDQLGEKVLVALGLILLQLQLLGKKIMGVQLPEVLVWLKHEAQNFFRIELLKKWFMTTALPLVIGKPLLNRIERFFGAQIAAIRRRYAALLIWYRDLNRFEQVLAALIVLTATLALSVTSLGLWLILFSVKLPFWAVALLTSLGQATWESVRRMVFKSLAFLQLGWLWRGIRWALPKGWLERKRRFNFRVARMVVRQRRMTVAQLRAQKDSPWMRRALRREARRQRRDT